ncbi:site-specific integrase [Marinilabilia salmonicolor]|uniref:Integrase-like protein n=1 Tax=Marinilabilia salmonicolor TaxID=989 RepID=A0A368VDB7_9BACT|nr:site-specific integrase [Marinilabilia salmonicolor]RCW38683.1 integrase-like protein [Marinilabilia salmonicolor]
MASIIYQLKPSKKSPEKSSIYVRVYHGRLLGQKCSTGINVHPNHWSVKNNKIKSAYDKNNKNADLTNLKRYIEDILENVRDYSTIPNGWLKQTVDNYFKGVPVQNKVENIVEQETTLYDYISEFIANSKDQINLKTGKKLSYRVYRDYIRTFELLKDFAGNKPLNWNDIDLNFYDRFIMYLQKINIGTTDEPKYFSANTVGKFIKNLKIFLNKATEDGINTNLKYKSHKFVKISVQSDNIYLTTDDLKKIEDLDLSNFKGKEKVRDLFLIGCWTGLRFGDLSNIRPENIKDGFIYVEQSKTGDRVVIPVHPVVTSILDRYDGQLPPAISNQKTNDALKVIAKKAEINEPITISSISGGVKHSRTYQKWELVSSHTARRSFATNLYKAGFPSQSIMKITGHKSENAFLKYIKVTPEEHAHLLKDFWVKTGI